MARAWHLPDGSFGHRQGGRPEGGPSGQDGAGRSRAVIVRRHAASVARVQQARWTRSGLACCLSRYAAKVPYPHLSRTLRLVARLEASDCQRPPLSGRESNGPQRFSRRRVRVRHPLGRARQSLGRALPFPAWWRSSPRCRCGPVTPPGRTGRALASGRAVRPAGRHDHRTTCVRATTADLPPRLANNDATPVL